MFDKNDSKSKWCETCGGAWDEESDFCSNPTCVKGKKLGISDEKEEDSLDKDISLEDGILDDPNAPFIINMVLNLVQCKKCNAEWNTNTNFCSNLECSNSESFANAVKTHEPPPVQSPDGRPVTVLLMSILNHSGYLGLANALKHRARDGAIKYGTMLKSHNGRNMELDALQESLDLNQYLFGCVVERDQEIKILKRKIEEHEKR